MSRLRQLRRGRVKGGGGGHGMPALIPMIDMLTILVVYLLVHAADYEILPNSKNIAIPMSTAEKSPRETITLLVTREEVFVNGARVMSVSELDAGEAAVPEPLANALRAEAAKLKVGRTAAEPPEVTVMADKGLPYRALRRIMNAGTAAEFGKLSLAVVEKETAVTRRVP